MARRNEWKADNTRRGEKPDKNRKGNVNREDEDLDIERERERRGERERDKDRDIMREDE